MVSKTKVCIVAGAAALAVAVALLAWRLGAGAPAAGVSREDRAAAPREAAAAEAPAARAADGKRAAGARKRPKISPQRAGAVAGVEATPGDGEVNPQESPEERAEREAVERFDALVFEKWNEPCEREITAEEMEEFAEAFRRIPDARKEEEIHHALNMIPDKNIFLLTGILFDKTQDEETMGAVFNDIVNRDESIKLPILRMVMEDETHPNRAEAAQILDATGQLPVGMQNR